MEASALAFLSCSSAAFKNFLSFFFHGILETHFPLQSPSRDGKWQTIQLASEIERQKVARAPTANPQQDVGAIFGAAGLDLLEF